MTYSETNFSIRRFLGLGKDRKNVLSAISLIIVGLFYFFVIGSALQTPIYIFEHRVSYERIFQMHVISLEVDSLIVILSTIVWMYFSINAKYRIAAITVFISVFLGLLFMNHKMVSLVGSALTLPVIICLIIINGLVHNKILSYDKSITAHYISISAFILGFLGIVSLILYIATGVSTISVEIYSYAIFHQLLSIFSPLILAALVFSVPLKILLDYLFSKLKIKKNSLPVGTVEEKFTKKQVRIYLMSCVMLAICIAIIPHLSTTNPNNVRVGVDSPFYVEWLNQIKNHTGNPTNLVFKDIASGDRPLTLIIIYLITVTINADTFQVVEFSPLVLSPLLVLVTFFLTRELTSNDKISILASFLCAISFQTLIGIYAGFYANWIALILGYLAFVLIVKSLKHPSKLKYVGVAVLMTGMLLAHVHSWIIMISVAFIFLFVLQMLDYYPRKRFIILYLILSSSVAVDIIRALLIGTPTGIVADLSISLQQGLGIYQFIDRFNSLADTVQTYYGGAFANIAILGLVAYWLVRCRPRELTSIFVLIFLSTALVPLFLGDWVLQSRVLFDIPFQIPVAISLYFISKENHKLLYITMVLITGYLSLHVIANLGYVRAG